MTKAFYILSLLICQQVLARGIDTVNLKDIPIIVSPIQKGITELSPTQELTKSDLQKIDAINIADGLNHFSGVNIKDYGGIGGLKTISIRSLSAYHTNVLIDGIRINDAQAGQVDLGKYFTNNITSVELLNGSSEKCLPASAYSSVYAINIKTDHDAQDSFALNGDFSAGSFNTYRTAINLKQRINTRNQIGVSFQGQYSKGNYEYTLNNLQSSSIERRQNGDIRSGQVDLDHTYQLKNNDQLTTKLYYHHAEQGLPGAVILYNPINDQRLRREDWFLQSVYHKSWNKKLQSKFYFKHASNWLKYTDPSFLNSEGFLEDQFLQKSYYIATANQYQLHRDIRLQISTDLDFNSLATTVYEDQNPQRLSWISYIGIMAKPFKCFKIEGSLSPMIIQETNHLNVALPSKNKLMPYAALGYQPFKSHDLYLRASYKESFRLPSFNDLYYVRVGNTDLIPEQAQQFNLGVTYQKNNFTCFDHIAIITDIFQNNIDNKIVAIPTKNLFIWSMQNIGQVETRGIEWSLNWQLKPVHSIRFYGNVNFLYQEALDKTDPASPTYNQQVAYTLVQNISSSTSMAYKKLSIHYNTIYNGYSYALNENIATNLVPAWITQDIVLNYELKIKHSTIVVYGAVHNIFDQQYEIIKSFPMVGRNYRIGIRVRS